MRIHINFDNTFDFAEDEYGLEKINKDEVIMESERITIQYDYGLEEQIKITYGLYEEKNGFTKRDLAEIILKEYERFQAEDKMLESLYYDINNFSLIGIIIEINNENDDRNRIFIKPKIFNYNE